MLVPAGLLPRAMAFSSAGMQAAVIGGPALGGLVFFAGATAVYATCAAFFTVGCVLVFAVRYDHVPPPREPVTLRTLLAGAEYVWRRKALLGAVSLDLFAVLLGGAEALLPMFAKDILHVGPWGAGPAACGAGCWRAGHVSAANALAAAAACRPHHAGGGGALWRVHGGVWLVDQLCAVAGGAGHFRQR